jgi:hypothetical protein
LVTVRKALLGSVPYLAVTVTIVLKATGLVPIWKVAIRSPSAIVTDAGTVAAALLLVRATVKPPAGAAAVSVTVPVADEPPIGAVGLRTRLCRPGGEIVRVAVLVTVPARAVIVALVDAATGWVVTWKVV